MSSGWLGNLALATGRVRSDGASPSRKREETAPALLLAVAAVWAPKLDLKASARDATLSLREAPGGGAAGTVIPADRRMIAGKKRSNANDEGRKRSETHFFDLLVFRLILSLFSSPQLQLLSNYTVTRRYYDLSRMLKLFTVLVRSNKLVASVEAPILICAHCMQLDIYSTVGVQGVGWRRKTTSTRIK